MKHYVNWHAAASCAVQIELRNYAHQLEFLSEYTLGKNSYRIDLLVIKKLTGCPIPKNIARIFKAYNLFEIKGIGSSVKINSYYKTIGYAGLLIDQISHSVQYAATDITITFLSFHYPKKLMKHLINERNLVVAKSSPGIYDISKETFNIQIIVTRELPPEENLYLRCLTNQLQDVSLINRLADDYKEHQDNDIYVEYLHQLTTANNKKKGMKPMICEGLLNLFGTSSEEIIERTRKDADDYYLPKMNELAASNELLISSNESLTTFNESLISSNKSLISFNKSLESSNKSLESSNKSLISSNKSLASQIDYLKDLLKQNNILFNLESVSKPNTNEENGSQG